MDYMESDTFISVVQSVKDVFRSRGIPVLLYNSRGVGKSTGRASWTGEPEREDYQAVVDWVVKNRRSLTSGDVDEGADDARRMTVYCCVSLYRMAGIRRSWTLISYCRDIPTAL
jgi:hypothetical protein